jgi:hypothetical protein
MIADPVILPVIRRALPTLLAQAILGDPPDPSVDFYTKNGIPGRVAFKKENYNYFLRVYNRRKRHHPEYIDSLGYLRVRIPASKVIAARRWCAMNLKNGSYVNSMVDFWFAHEKDYTLFLLRWS